MSDFSYQDLLPLGHDDTPYRLVTEEHVSTFEAGGERFVRVEPEALTLLTKEAMLDIAHLFRPGHLAQLAAILDDEEASANDHFVALELLKNANISAGRILPSCQDTGTAIVKGKRGQQVLTRGGDEEAISRGVYEAYHEANLRYSQMAPLTMWDEVNTRNNLPAEIKIAAVDGDAYKFLFMAKGGGSANKSFLFQETKALLNPTSLFRFLDENLRKLGTAACPPYHLAVVIGGTSAESTMETAKLASARYLDTLPREGSASGHAFRDVEPRGRDPRADPAVRHRRAVRRQVLLPRRPGHPPAAPRRLVPGRHRRVVQRRPPGAREDHRRRHLPGGARARPGQVPPRHDRRAPVATTSCRSTSAARWPRSGPSCPATR